MELTVARCDARTGRSRTALYHSMTYRSAVLYGRGRAVKDGAEKQRILEELTAVIEVAIESRSVKALRGGPRGPRHADPGAPGTAGVTPVRGV